MEQWNELKKYRKSFKFDKKRRKLLFTGEHAEEAARLFHRIRHADNLSSVEERMLAIALDVLGGMEGTGDSRKEISAGFCERTEVF